MATSDAVTVLIADDEPIARRGMRDMLDGISWVTCVGESASGPATVEAITEGWDPVMVRHSLAHRGAEAAVLPRAVERGTSVITFNNTCYGRLLAPRDVYSPTPADCYRYTMAQPAVTACWTAPATLEQLDQNLAALHAPDLPEDCRAALRAHGDWVYQEDTMFRKLVRVL